MQATEHSIVPSFTFADATKAIAFYEKAFGAEAESVMRDPDGKFVMHACLRVGENVFYLADDMMRSGRTVEAGFADACTMTLQVEDADATFQRALDNGCEVDQPLENQFWGDRYGQVRDPFGLVWAVLSPVEELSRDEVMRRAKKLFGSEGQGAGAQA
jgi:PhnB protein